MFAVSTYGNSLEIRILCLMKLSITKCFKIFEKVQKHFTNAILPSDSIPKNVINFEAFL